LANAKYFGIGDKSLRGYPIYRALIAGRDKNLQRTTGIIKSQLRARMPVGAKAQGAIDIQQIE
jgi:hypothetical protein